MSYVSNEYSTRYRMDTSDAPGHIYIPSPSTGGRKVAGSNPVAPMVRRLATVACWLDRGDRDRPGVADGLIAGALELAERRVGDRVRI